MIDMLINTANDAITTNVNTGFAFCANTIFAVITTNVGNSTNNHDAWSGYMLINMHVLFLMCQVIVLLR